MANPIDEILDAIDRDLESLIGELRRVSEDEAFDGLLAQLHRDDELFTLPQLKSTSMP